MQKINVTLAVIDVGDTIATVSEESGGAVLAKGKISHEAGYTWTCRVLGSRFIYREPSRWINYYLKDNHTYPPFQLRVTLSLFRRLWRDLLTYGRAKWST